MAFGTITPRGGLIWFAFWHCQEASANRARKFVTPHKLLIGFVYLSHGSAVSWRNCLEASFAGQRLLLSPTLRTEGDLSEGSRGYIPNGCHLEAGWRRPTYPAARAGLPPADDRN